MGQYFDRKDLTDLRLSRLDSRIAFDWGNGSPDRRIEPDTFSIRWEGRIQPLYSE